MDGSQVLPGFNDFDSHSVFEEYERYILKPDALNFVIEFDTDTAVASTELPVTTLKELLKIKVRQ